MAIYDITRQSTGGHSFGERLAELVNRFLTWKDDRATRKALSMLSDHELDDIGLVRGDIDRLTRR
ncbi:DUF1127 domain-containing protein [Ovoidimarina sediminis]|uniref:DUF1127 domain-containing protein n=1 Tax=Ovoidimarina sediminis TaxID=3079856 RepID=UPI0029085FC8|nr:DUF1127 domain-containing protein [Rhodophyticola sp. MJ-SS7]MDU8943296.1 DUF1127 domain-containing protein [Rhodophyticola sp. MJ-SS7]